MRVIQRVSSHALANPEVCRTLLNGLKAKSELACTKENECDVLSYIGDSIKNTIKQTNKTLWFVYGERFRQIFILEDAIGSHACSLEVLLCV
jgi:hypothetical protein